MFENDAGTYLIALYCDGPSPAARHERFTIIIYGRVLKDTFDSGRSWIPARKWQDDEGQPRRARSHDTHAKKAPKNSAMRDAGLPELHYQYRFRCDWCGLDEQRRRGPDFDAIFDKMAANDVHEVPVREFVRIAWG